MGLSTMGLTEDLDVLANKALDKLSFQRARHHYDDARAMADTLTMFGIKSIGTPIEVVDGESVVLSYGVLITEESFDQLKQLLKQKMEGSRHVDDED